ncbi:hypothetical protein AN641_06520 [Candidatus Epulonipiscioides gigas]|nr:hypothetical protein AN641_06520 [Epulopiscium sp. SCG-C07WGA-EpuloA2]
MYITIDTGTTNTRVRLFNNDFQITDIVKLNIGVKHTAINGSNKELKAGIKNSIEALLKNNNNLEIEQIIASGMITSALGLYEIPHLVVPVSKADLKDAAVTVLMEDVSNIPITFITGVKNNFSQENPETMDIMRGEEVETFAILEELPKGVPYLLVLPGSHSKFVSVDEKGQITGCLTTLTGELIEVITNNTIISESVNKKFVDEYKKEFVLKGYNQAKKVGMSRAAFLCRINSNFYNYSYEEVANFLLGIVLQSDVDALINSKAITFSSSSQIIIAGKYVLKQGLIDILTSEGYCVTGFFSQNEDNLSGFGALSIILSK